MRRSTLPIAVALLAAAHAAADGMLDPSFGHGGIVITDIHPPSSYGGARSVVVALVVLLAAVPFAGADGMLDPSFGTGGLVITNFGGAASERANSLAILPDGRAVAAAFEVE